MVMRGYKCVKSMLRIHYKYAKSGYECLSVPGSH